MKTWLQGSMVTQSHSSHGNGVTRFWYTMLHWFTLQARAKASQQETSAVFKEILFLIF